MTREVKTISCDILIIGGGAAGCIAAVTAKEEQPRLDVLIMEKAHVERSGCLAAGINALNAYLNPGETPASFLRYVKNDANGVVREDLLLTMAAGFNRAARRLEEWGLPILKDEEGNYLSRGRRSIRILGERIKPIIAQAVYRSGARVLNRTVATNYILQGNKVVGAFGFNVRTGDFYVVKAGTVICATGGACGIYAPNNPGAARHKTWYPPFNAGAGYAMGIRAGAEMTGFEMRFIALRVKDTLAPTGTVVQGIGAKARQVNARGEEYLKEYPEVKTFTRLQATLEQWRQGKGPCYLDLNEFNREEMTALKEAYLNMCPGMVLYLADRGGSDGARMLEITGSEPYIVGGHTQAGYWVDVHRRTTLENLYAAGEVAGGAPKKYATGSMAEGELAVRHALKNLPAPVPEVGPELISAEMDRVFRPMAVSDGFSPQELEEAMQKTMDEYAGGISTGYTFTEKSLTIAKRNLAELTQLSRKLAAADYHQLMRAHEVIDRLLVARVLIEHLLYRKETRWPCYQTRLDYPFKDDKRWLIFVNSRYDKERNRVEIRERACCEVRENEYSA